METPVHKLEKEVVSFVKTATKGRIPPLQFDGRYKTYSIQDPYYLIEYKIEQDTCVMAGIHFRGNRGLYQRVAQETKAVTKHFEENRLKELNSHKIIFVYDDREGLITVSSFDFALSSLRRQGC